MMANVHSRGLMNSIPYKIRWLGKEIDTFDLEKQAKQHITVFHDGTKARIGMQRQHISVVQVKRNLTNALLPLKFGALFIQISGWEKPLY